MRNWFAAAAQAIQRRPPEEPQDFEVRCGCGRTVTGKRMKSHQRIACPACNAWLFVLPASVYPPLLKPTATASKAVRHKRVANEAETPVAVAPPRVAQATATPDPPRPKPVRELAPLVKEQVGHIKQWWRGLKLITPFRAVLLAVVALIGGTTYWVVHSRTLDQAALTITDAVKKGEAALREDDVHEAARQFGLAARALDLLGRDDPQARGIRQVAHETTATSQLAVRTLHEMLGEAIDAGGESADSTWPETFRGSYRDMWVVLDTTVTRAAEASDSPIHVIDCPVVVGKSRASVIAELTAFKVLPQDGKPRRVVFAAQLEDCRPDPSQPHTWLIVLRPDTGFLWSNQEPFQALGFAPDAKSDAALAEQTKLLGIVP